MSKIVIHARRFWRQRDDGTLVPISAPTSTGLASHNFGSTGVHRTGRRRRHDPLQLGAEQ